MSDLCSYERSLKKSRLSMKCLSELSVIITEMDVVVNLNHGEII